MSEKRLGATFVAAIAVETIGAVAPFKGKTYMPSPRYYLASWILWFILGLVAALGQRAADYASRFSVLVVLAMMVVGPFGEQAVAFLTGAGRFFPSQQGGAA